MNSHRALIEWDWLLANHANWLHFAEMTDDEATQLVMTGPPDTVRYVCGYTGTHPSIPGFFERQSVRRCNRCCDRLGYPHGDGSPKNDKACRPLVLARIGPPETMTLDHLCEIFHDASHDAELWDDWEAQARCRTAWADLTPGEQECTRAGVRAVLVASRGEAHEAMGEGR